jgi:5-methylcytosine-specific restriction endonuclease McrA
MEESKTCTQCGQIKNLSGFYKLSADSNKVRSKCKPCVNDQSKHYRENNLEKTRELTRLWKESNPISVALNRQLWKLQNPEKVAISNKSYYERNREQFSEIAKAWRANNPEKVAGFRAAHRARKNAAITYVISAKDLWHLKHDSCLYCGNPAKHLDHIIPLSRGGNHSIGNLAPACVRCNTSKNNKTIMEWRIWKKRMEQNA